VGLFLDHLRANVLLARNASEGLDAIQNSSPNLELSDINMPGMDVEGSGIKTVVFLSSNYLQSFMCFGRCLSSTGIRRISV
jgi:CheY-like chemotaxis protein